MAVDLLTFAIGSVDRAAQSNDLDLVVKMAGSRPKEISGKAFAVQLASTSLAEQPAKITSELSVAKKFEAIFVAQLMTSILPEDSEYFGEGFAGDAWRSMMSEQLANVAVKQTDFGIASLIDKSAVNTSTFNASADPNSELLGALLEERLDK